MKTLFALSLSLFLSVGLYAQITVDGTTPQLSAAQIKWNTQDHDFGKIAQGKPVTFRYEFTNLGSSPLTIASAKASCGCTTPSWTQTPVQPGENGYVEATFNASAEGMFSKSVTVTPEGATAMALTLKGEVVAQ